MFALSLYTITHKFYSFPSFAHKGKYKGKKISQQDITECGNRRTVMYVRIYYNGGFFQWTSTFTMIKMVCGMNCKEIIIFLVFILPAEKEQPIGLWGQRHLRYLKEYHRNTYTTLLTSGRLNTYLADIDRQAQERFEILTEQMKQAQGITEQLKVENTLEWVGRMNNIRACAMEVVNEEIIYN